MRADLSRNIFVIFTLSIVSHLPTDSLMAADLSSCHIEKENQLLPIEEQHQIDVDWGHILCGDINARKAKATGYHHRPDGKDSDVAYIGEITRVNEATAVYEAAPVYVLDEGEWRQKKRGSTFFPDHCTITQVANSIAYAASYVTCRYVNGKWGGASAPTKGQAGYCYGKDQSVLEIDGYFKRKSQTVATAWPLIKPRRPDRCQVVN